jgi:pimeloyl-ACP methyl ester carboxylesterase
VATASQGGARGALAGRVAYVLALALAGCCCGGCTWITYLGTDTRGSELGRTYYVGGAGTFGHVGTLDVPHGLRRAGYEGSIEVFGWQSIVGGTLRDQMHRERNLQQARRLAERIQDYLKRHPGRHVNIIALSAGTGIATWAVELLPADARVGTVVFLASSLSNTYDLSGLLRRVDERLYNFYSPDDPVLRYALPLAGSVDRRTFNPAVAGLIGLAEPEEASLETARLYRQRVRNMPYRRQYRDYGYRGMHTDAVSSDFVEHVIAPLLKFTSVDEDDEEAAAEP